MAYHYSPNEKLSQGDVLRRVKVVTNIVGNENYSPKIGESRIIVITRNCEIDKPLTASNAVHVARIARLSSQSERMQNLIRDNSVLNIFYLPIDRYLSEESYIDWRTVQLVSKAMLNNWRTQQENYECTLERTTITAMLVGWRDFTQPEDEDNIEHEEATLNITSQQTGTS